VDYYFHFVNKFPLNEGCCLEVVVYVEDYNFFILDFFLG